MVCKWIAKSFGPDDTVVHQGLSPRQPFESLGMRVGLHLMGSYETIMTFGQLDFEEYSRPQSFFQISDRSSFGNEYFWGQLNGDDMGPGLSADRSCFTWSEQLAELENSVDNVQDGSGGAGVKRSKKKKSKKKVRLHTLDYLAVCFTNTELRQYTYTELCHF